MSSDPVEQSEAPADQKGKEISPWTGENNNTQMCVRKAAMFDLKLLDFLHKSVFTKH